MIFLFVILIVVFFLAYSYFNQIRLYEQIQYDRMLAITKTLSAEIDGDEHQRITLKYQEKDELKTYEQDSSFYRIHRYLKDAQQMNKTGSAIYTLVYDPIRRQFFYGASSSETPYYRHQYKQFPDKLKQDYLRGGIIPRYSSENGTWISAFWPIKNSRGQTVAVVEADVKFNEFIQMARKQVLFRLGMALIVIVVISLFLYRSVKKILLKEEELKRQLLEQKHLIEDKNKDITDSINYAKRIQDAILPPKREIASGLRDFFVLYEPRDIVSGDFYWYHQFEDGGQVLAVADCTGHGIPGALVSVIGSSLLNEIVKQREITSPAEILRQLDKGVHTGFGSSRGIEGQRDGMDISICYIPPAKNELIYGGALRPLLCLRQGEILEFKGDRFPIGGGDLYEKTAFEEQKVPIQQGDVFYMFSDGFPDQFGGPKGKKMMTGKFKKHLLQHAHLSFEEQCKKLVLLIEEWQGDLDRVDDVLVMGFSV